MIIEEWNGQRRFREEATLDLYEREKSKQLACTCRGERMDREKYMILSTSLSAVSFSRKMAGPGPEEV